MNKTQSKYLKIHSAKESGQALLLIAVLMVALLGSLGLAIDGGGMFLLWRDAQNAADAAALQAAFTYCTVDANREEQAIAAGERSLVNNGFTDTGTLNTDDGDVPFDLIVSRVNDTPVTGISDADLPANVQGDHTFVVIIEAQKPAYFIQLVYGGPLNVRTTSLGACSPAEYSIYEGYGLFSMASTANCSSGTPRIKSTGSSHYYGSSIFANSDIQFGGSSYLFNDGAGVDYGTGSGIDPSKTSTVSGSGTVPQGDFGDPLPASAFPPLFNIEDFAPQEWSGTSSDGSVWTEVETFGTGYAHFTNGNARFRNEQLEGLYFVDGDVRFDNGVTIGGLGITIVTTGQVRGAGSVNGTGSNATLWQPFTAVSGTESLSIFTTMEGACDAGQGQSAVGFSGSGIFGTGIIYAPNGHVNFSASDVIWCGSIIALTMSPSGSDKWFIADQLPTDVAGLRQIGLPSAFDSYTGWNCDYLPDPVDPYYFLGDLDI